MNGPKSSTSIQSAIPSLDPEALAPSETPWQEFLRIFHKDYQALFWILGINAPVSDCVSWKGVNGMVGRV